MSSVVQVAIHSSQSPESVRGDLLDCLKKREVNHKFHYESYKQAQKWLALHQAYSPSRNDPDCSRVYDASFDALASHADGRRLELVGLGCGGGQKDARLLKLLQARGNELTYTPIDVSLALVLAARQQAQGVIAGLECHPLVCDLARAEDLPTVLGSSGKPGATRFLTFFGMIPNFEPGLILSRLGALVRPGDWLLFSANLAPGPDYLAGIQRVLPGYDNELTRDWLGTFLFDLGVDPHDGTIHFSIETGENDLKRIVARFNFVRQRTIDFSDERFEFAPGDSVQLFFSYRYTPDRVAAILRTEGLVIRDQWITNSEEEGVFLCQKIA